MQRRYVLPFVSGLIAAAPGWARAQVTAQGRQFSRHGYFASGVVRTRTLAECGSSDEKRDGKRVKITFRCRELDGAGAGRSLTMRGYLYRSGESGPIKRCKDSVKTTGNTSRVLELSCSVTLPKEAR